MTRKEKDLHDRAEDLLGQNLHVVRHLENIVVHRKYPGLEMRVPAGQSWSPSGLSDSIKANTFSTYAALIFAN